MDVSPAPNHRRQTVILLVVVATALALLVVPVQATYLNRVGSDFAEYRTASCGAPIASLAGAEPGLGGGSAAPIGASTAETACQAASGRRAIGSLILLLGAAIWWGTSQRRRDPATEPVPDEVPA